MSTHTGRAISIRGARLDTIDVDLVVEALAIPPDGDSPAFIDLELNVAATNNPIESVAIFLPIAAAERLVAVVGQALDAHRRGDYGVVAVIGVCRVCGCTDDDCRGCIERIGGPCSWVAPDLCSACVGAEVRQ